MDSKDQLVSLHFTICSPNVKTEHNTQCLWRVYKQLYEVFHVKHYLSDFVPRETIKGTNN